MQLSDEMMEILGRIMAEVLSVLALATKQIKQGRFSECTPPIALPLPQKCFREVCQDAVEGWG
jgi:hypothetical protein